MSSFFAETSSYAESPQPEPRVSFGNTISKMERNMSFVGLFTIIYGVLNCLTIIGAVIGVPLVIMGLRLRDAADAFDAFDSENDIEALKRAFEKQRSYFFINKVLILVGIAFFVLYILFFAFFLGAGFFAEYSNMYQGV